MAKRWFVFSGHGLAGVVSLISCLAFPLPVSAEEEGTGIPLSAAIPMVELLVKIEPNQAQVGSYRPGDRIKLQTDPETAGTGGSLVPADGTDGKIFEQGWGIDPDFTVTPFKAGTLVLPELEIRNVDGKVLARTKPLSIQVISSISPKDPKPQEPAPMRPPVDVPIPVWMKVAAALAGAVALTGLGWLIFKWLQRRLRKPAAPPPPADLRALQAIDALVRAGHMERGTYKIHYFRLSEIIKHWLGERYSFDAPESTTGELMNWLREKQGADGLREEMVLCIGDFFNTLDRVKFTDHVPSAPETLPLNAEARKIIVGTRRAFEPILEVAR